jgi:hypothetical protein
MNINEASEALSRAGLGGQRRPVNQLVIAVNCPNAVGGTPFVSIERMQCGIDWDQGRLYAYPSQMLTRLSPADVQAIRDSAAKAQSWHAFQQHKKQADQIKALQVENEYLRSRLAVCSPI